MKNPIQKITLNILLIIILGLTALFHLAKDAYACNLDVTPSSGPPGATFQAQLTDCTEGLYVWSLLDSNDHAVVSGPVTGINIDSANNTFAIISNGTETDKIYTLQVVLLGTFEFYNANIVIEGSSLAINCGDVVAANFTGCPSICPAVWQPSIGDNGSGVDEWRCTLTTSNLPICASNGKTGIDSAIGCIPIENINLTASFFITWGLGVLGGVAFLLIIYGSYLVFTSSGDSRKAQSGKELITAAITGILFLIFSIFILRFIGSSVLNII